MIINNNLPISYIIYQENSMIKALNGNTGSIDYASSTTSSVINKVILSLKNDGGMIYIKEGLYDIDSPLIFYPKVSLQGSGNSTIFKRAKNMSIKMIKFASGEYYGGKTSLKISDIYIDGNKNEGGTDWAIYLGDTNRACPDFAFFENINIVNSDGVAINKGCYWNHFHNVNIWYPPNKAIDMSIGLDYPNLNTFYNCRFTGNANSLPAPNGGTGIIMHGTDNSFINCDFSSWHIAVTGSGYRHNFLNCWFELNDVMLDTSNIYQLSLINPRTSFINNESGIIIEGKPILYIGTSAWKYGGNDQTATPLIKTTYLNVNIINLETAITTIVGQQGYVYWSMPFQGPSYKKVLVNLDWYKNNTDVAQTITFPVPFAKLPRLLIDDSNLSISSRESLTLPKNMISNITGWIIVEGY